MILHQNHRELLSGNKKDESRFLYYFFYISFLWMDFLSFKMIMQSGSYKIKAIVFLTLNVRKWRKKIGQLMYINVDGYGSSYTIHPLYDDLVERIQPGGVLPHYNSSDIEKIKKSNKVLQGKSKLALMIGVDHQAIKSSIGSNYNIGLGYGDNIFKDLENQSLECYKRISSIEAALHKYMGINNPLGPSIEYSPHGGVLSKEMNYKRPRIDSIISSFQEMELETTLKHFPYIPKDFNLHGENRDTKTSLEKVEKKFLPIFKTLHDRSSFIMTTHLYNSNIDPINMTTFSKKWIDKLRNDIGF